MYDQNVARVALSAPSGLQLSHWVRVNLIAFSFSIMSYHTIYFAKSFLANRIYHSQQIFQPFSALFLGWYDVTMSNNVKSSLKQCCVCRRWNVQSYKRYSTLKQRCHFQRQNNVANMSICKKLKNKPRVKSKIIFLTFK